MYARIQMLVFSGFMTLFIVVCKKEQQPKNQANILVKLKNSTLATKEKLIAPKLYAYLLCCLTPLKKKSLI